MTGSSNGKWSTSAPKRDVSAIPEESSQMSEEQTNEQDEDDEDSRSEATTHTTSISSPGGSNGTQSSGRLENGDPLPLLAVGLYQTTRAAAIPTLSELAACEEVAAAAAAAQSIEQPQGFANPAVNNNEMRGPPPHWMPPRPPSAVDPMLPHRPMSSRYEDEEENYEDPETFDNRKVFSPFGSLHRAPGNSYEISASQQRRSMMRDSTLQTTLSDEDFYLNQPPSLLHKNEAGAYFIPAGTLSHGINSSPLTSSLRYNDERCHPSSSMMGDHSGTALLHHTNKRRNSRIMVGGTPLPSTTIPPLSGSLKKRPPSRRSESSLKDLWRPTPTVLCLLFCLILAVGLIVVLLLRVPSKSETDNGANVGYSKAHPTLHSLPARLRLGERVYVELVNEEDTELHIAHPMRVSLNASINPGAKLAIMGKLAGIPTTSDHDLLWKLNRGEPIDKPTHHSPIDNAMIGARVKRSEEEEEEEEIGKRWVSFDKFMLPGVWHLRFVNDVRDRPEPFIFILNSHPSDLSCEGDCNGKGECMGGGRCRCENGYTGDNCEIPTCPVQCSGKGIAVNGKCVCDPGFKGVDCSLLSSWCETPDCNGNGVCTLEGKCECRRGWTGRDCEERVSTNPSVSIESEDEKGGRPILQTDCPHPSCSGNGRCYNGICLCYHTHEGSACESLKSRPLPPPAPSRPRGRGSEEKKRKEKEEEEERHVKISMREDATSPLPTTVLPSTPRSIDIFSASSSESCSHHGRLSADGLCECENGWKGEDCDQARCSPACLNGECKENKCVCLPGWRGSACGRRECPEGCGDHGKCGDDGKCTCDKGWNGGNCYEEGCPSDCGEKGECRLKSSGDWSCHCQWPFTGRGCEIEREMECGDGIDNDGDGLRDCEDPDCCEWCSKSQQCTPVPSPREMIERMKEEEKEKGREAEGGPFIERLRFALRTTQSYVNKPFNPSLVSSIRGRLVHRHPLTGSTLALRGARVSDLTNPMHGYTLTRNDTEDGDGIFDLIVDGGRTVVLQFLRAPFPRLEKSFYVLPNQIVHVGDVFIDGKEKSASSCPSSSSSSRVPPMPSITDSTESADGPVVDQSITAVLPYPRLVADSRTVSDQLPIRDTSFRLVYDSSRVSGGEITMRLTDDTVDAALRLVHVNVEVAGKRHEWTLTARPNLRHSWSWNGQDAYGLRMRGRVAATVKIGYQWDKCEEIRWVERRLFLQGLSGREEKGEIGRGWTIDRQHFLDVENGVLERGDGARVQLNDQSTWEATTVIGTGEKRGGPCVTDAECNGEARKMRLANPSAVATAMDGSVYMVDHELIRKISPDGLTRTVMTMKTVPQSSDAATPSLAIDPRDGSLYVTLPSRYQIVRVTEKGGPINAEKRTVLEAGMEEQQVIAGTGEKCTDEHCGDEGEAIQARLKTPKAIAFDSQGRLYVADGNRIRMIYSTDRKSMRRITTIGDKSSYATSGPLPCPLASLHSPIVSSPLKTLRMQWPTAISIDQTTDTLYVVEASHAIYAIRGDIFTILRGIPPFCLGSSSNSSSKPNQVAAGPDGSIYVLEHHEKGEGKQIVRIVHPGHRGEIFAGGPSIATTTSPSSSPSSPSSIVRSRLRVSDVISMAVDSRGRVVVADASANVIRRVGPKSMEIDHATKRYRLTDPERNEIYFFSKSGFHHSTVDLLTGRTIANFSYAGDDGSLLSSVVEGSESISLSRDDIWMRIASGRGVEMRLEIDKGELKRVESDGYAPISFRYKDGLMVERGMEGEGTTFLSYSQGGIVREMVTGGGIRVEMEEKEGEKGDYISIRTRRAASIESNQRFFLEYRSIKMDRDSPSFRLIPLGWSGAHLSLPSTGRSDLFDASSIGGDTVARDLIGARPEDTVDGVITVRKTSLRAVDGRPSLSSRLEWSTASSRSKSTKEITHVTRTAKINGSPLLSIRFDRESLSDSFSGPQSEPLLRVRYNDKGQIISMGAEVDALVESDRRLPLIEVVYDASGLPILRKWGVRREEIKRDSLGRVESRVWSTNESERVREWKGDYGEEQGWPTSITAYSGEEYEMEYTKGGEIVEVKRGDERSSFERLSLMNGGEMRRRKWQWAEHSFTVILDRSTASIPYSPLNLGLSIGDRWMREWRSADGERHARVERDERSRVRRIENGAETTTVRYTPGGAGEIRQIRSSTILESFSWQSGLIIQQKIAMRPSKTDEWRESTFDLHYDDLLRVTKIDASIDGHLMDSLVLVYDPRTMRMTSVGGFTVQQEPAKTTIQEGTMTIERWDSSTRKQRKTIVKMGETNCDVQISRDAFDRPTVVEWTVNGEKKEKKTVEYDGMGRLVKMNKGEKEENRWKISYDGVGRLSTIGNESIEWAENGMIERRGSEEYETDANGWIEKRGLLSFDFDSLGRLVSVQSKKSKMDWNVEYDGFGRVALLRNGSIIYNLFHALPERKQLLTHFTRRDSSSSSRLFHLFYTDNSDLPFALREGEKKWALVYDGMDQLSMVVGEGGVEKELSYSPFGDIIVDSNSDLFIPIGGFRVGIGLPQIGVTILREGDNWRPWDARAGRFLSFPPSSLLPSTRDLIRDPSISLDPMRMPEQGWPWAPAQIPDDLTSWLSLVDAPTSVLDRLDTVVARSIDRPMLASRRLNRLDARIGWLKGETSVRGMRLPNDDVRGEIEWANDDDSWSALMQIVIDERNRTDSLHFSSLLSSEERLSLHRLLSDSSIVEGTEERLREEEATIELHLTQREEHLPADVQTSSHAHFSIHRGQDSIEIKRGTARIVVHYGKNAYSSTRDRLRDEWRRKWDAAVWAAEKRRVETGRRSISWTPAERKQLIDKGTVPGFGIRLRENTVDALPSIYSWEFVKE